MSETDLAYLRLCTAVWWAGAALWVERWVALAAAMPAPETSHQRALRARASFRLVG